MFNSLSTITRKSNLYFNKGLPNILFNSTTKHSKFQKIPKFLNTNIRSFSEGIQLKDKIRVVKSESIDDVSEDWGETLSSFLSREKYNNFNETFKVMNNKGVVISVEDINKLLSIVYSKNNTISQTIFHYVIDKNIPLNSVSYYYLIMGNIQSNLVVAIDLFLQASLLGVTQNLSVIISLYKAVASLIVEEDKIKYKSIIDEHLEKYYNEETKE